MYCSGSTVGHVRILKKNLSTAPAGHMWTVPHRVTTAFTLGGVFQLRERGSRPVRRILEDSMFTTAPSGSTISYVGKASCAISDKQAQETGEMENLHVFETRKRWTIQAIIRFHVQRAAMGCGITGVKIAPVWPVLEPPQKLRIMVDIKLEADFGRSHT